MRRMWRLAAGLVSVAVSGVAAAAGGSVRDQAVKLTYGPGHWNPSSSAILTGTDETGYQLFSSGWFYRVAGDTREFSLPVPDDERYLADGRFVGHWSDLHGKGFALQENTWVFDHEGPSGGFVTNMEVHNRTSAPLQITLFHWADADMAADPLGDLAASLNTQFIKFRDGASTASYRASRASHFRIAGFTQFLATFGDEAITELDDSGSPSGPSDLGAAYQFGPFTIPPGASDRAVWVSFFSNPPADHVKGDLLGVLPYAPLFGQAPDLGSRGYTLMRRTTQLESYPLAAPAATASFAGIDDFDGDYVDEAVFRDTLSGTTYVGADPVTGAPTLPLNWKLSATGDFDHDGKADILWRNTVSQKLVIWTMNGAARAGTLIPIPDQAANANWEVVGAADFNGDATRDLLWYNQATGKLVMWYMDAISARIEGLFTTPAGVGNNNWRVVAVGDYGKGPTGLGATQDIVWQNDLSHKVVVWHMDQAATRTSGVFTTPDDLGGLQVVGPR